MFRLLEFGRASSSSPWPRSKASLVAWSRRLAGEGRVPLTDKGQQLIVSWIHDLAAVYIMDRPPAVLKWSTILAQISLPVIELTSASLFARAIVVCLMSALTLVALSPASFTTPS